MRSTVWNTEPFSKTKGKESITERRVLSKVGSCEIEPPVRGLYNHRKWLSNWLEDAVLFRGLFLSTNPIMMSIFFMISLWKRWKGGNGFLCQQFQPTISALMPNNCIQIFGNDLSGPLVFLAVLLLSSAAMSDFQRFSKTPCPTHYYICTVIDMVIVELLSRTSKWWFNIWSELSAILSLGRSSFNGSHFLLRQRKWRLPSQSLRLFRAIRKMGAIHTFPFSLLSFYGVV